MTISARDQKLLGAWVVLVAIGYWFLRPDAGPVSLPTSANQETVAMAEQRLARLKDIAATASAKQEILKNVSAELAMREQGLIRAETVQQAQAQMITILRQLLGIETPTIEIRSMEMMPVEPFGDAATGVSYGLAPVRLQFECRMAQLVNVLAGLAAKPQLMGTRDFQILASNTKEKTVRVALTVVGVVPKELVPDKNKDKKGVAGL
jgi:hypothetical protein